MIELENTEVLGWEAAIRGMRNPMNSWEKSDSEFLSYSSPGGYDQVHDINGMVHDEVCAPVYRIGAADKKLMMSLAKAGSVDAKYRRMIVVTVDITAPLYWWKEFDTYKVGTVANSCSTMHKIQAKEFTLEDFSYEHLGVDIPAELNGGEAVHQNLWECILPKTIEALNRARIEYLRTSDSALKKQYWWQMIQLLPSSYNQRRTVMLNYEVLAGIYPKRKDHKLDEWHEFCDWIKCLPYSEIITLEEK